MLLKTLDFLRTRIHLLPDSLLQDQFGHHEVLSECAIFLVVQKVVHDLRIEFCHESLLADALKLGKIDITNPLARYGLEMSQGVIIEEVIVSCCEPSVFLESVYELVWEVLYRGSCLPKLWPCRVGTVPKEDVDLLLPIVILEVIVDVTFDRGEELKTTLSCLLYLLLVCQTTSVLYRYQITHFLVQLRILFQNAEFQLQILKVNVFAHEPVELHSENCLPDKLLEGICAIKTINTIGSNDSILELYILLVRGSRMV